MKGKRNPFNYFKKISIPTMSINQFFTIFILIFGTFIILLSTFFIQKSASEDIEKKIIQKNELLTEMISKHLKVYIQMNAETVDAVANISTDAQGDYQTIASEASRFYQIYSLFDLIFFMDQDGIIHFSRPYSSVIETNQYQYRDYYQHIMGGKERYISNLYMSTILNRPHFIIASSVYNQDQKIGLIGAGVSLDNVKDVIENLVDQFDGNIWIFDRNQQVVYSSKKNNVKQIDHMEKHFFSDQTNEVFLSSISSDQTTTVKRKINSDIYLSTITHLPMTGWIIVVEQSENSILLQYNTFYKNIRVIGFFLLVGLIIFGVFLSDIFIRPIENVIHRINKFDITQPASLLIEPSIYHEINELQDSFSGMQNRIISQIKQIKQSNLRAQMLQGRLTQIIETLDCGLLVCNQAGTIIFCNALVTDIFDIPKDQVMGNNIFYFFRMIGIDITFSTLKSWYQDQGTKVLEMNVELGEHSDIYLSLRMNQLVGLVSQENDYMIIIRDLTTIKHMEEELKKDDRIKTIGQMSAALIHNLGNPLAGITNLLEVMRDVREQKQVDQVLDFIQSEIADLNKMVIEFLDFTKYRGGKKDFVNISELLTEVYQIFHAQLKDQLISIRYMDYTDRRFEIFASRIEVKQAIINIVKNAVEAVDEHTGSVHIKLRIISNQVIIEISDNGEGMDKQMMEKIFNPFFSNKKGGNGLGLAISHQAIYENGGKIEVESHKGVGTSVRVLLQWIPRNKKGKGII